jgi:hypothetical protein
MEDHHFVPESPLGDYDGDVTDAEVDLGEKVGDVRANDGRLVRVERRFGARLDLYGRSDVAVIIGGDIGYQISRLC